MIKMFQARNGALLYFNIVLQRYQSTNPCEVFKALHRDSLSNHYIDRLQAVQLFKDIKDHGGIYVLQSAKPLVTSKGGTFLYVMGDGHTVTREGSEPIVGSYCKLVKP